MFVYNACAYILRIVLYWYMQCTEEHVSIHIVWFLSVNMIVMQCAVCTDCVWETNWNVKHKPHTLTHMLTEVQQNTGQHAQRIQKIHCSVLKSALITVNFSRLAWSSWIVTNTNGKTVNIFWERDREKATQKLYHQKKNKSRCCSFYSSISKLIIYIKNGVLLILLHVVQM